LELLQLATSFIAFNSQIMNSLGDSNGMLESAAKTEFVGQLPFGLLRLSETGLHEFSDRL
jgi:hypothetical protein